MGGACVRFGGQEAAVRGRLLCRPQHRPQAGGQPVQTQGAGVWGDRSQGCPAQPARTRGLGPVGGKWQGLQGPQSTRCPAPGAAWRLLSLPALLCPFSLTDSSSSPLELGSSCPVLNLKHSLDSQRCLWPCLSCWGHEPLLVERLARSCWRCWLCGSGYSVARESPAPGGM